MDAKIRGLAEVDQALAEIGAVAGSKVMRSSMFTATKPLLERARTNAPVRSGALKHSLTRTFSVKGSAGTFLFGDRAGSKFAIQVAPKTRNRTAIALYNLVYRLKKPRRGIYHGHFQEFGTKSGTKRTEFLKRALQSTANECINMLAVTLKKRIERVRKRTR